MSNQPPIPEGRELDVCLVEMAYGWLWLARRDNLFFGPPEAVEATEVDHSKIVPASVYGDGYPFVEKEEPWWLDDHRMSDLWTVPRFTDPSSPRNLLDDLVRRVKDKIGEGGTKLYREAILYVTGSETPSLEGFRAWLLRDEPWVWFNNLQVDQVAATNSAQICTACYLALTAGGE